MRLYPIKLFMLQFYFRELVNIAHQIKQNGFSHNVLTEQIFFIIVILVGSFVNIFLLLGQILKEFLEKPGSQM
jgi:hypothetical protein